MFGRAYDLAIIGGGLTGAAIARDAAGRGLSVFLCEEADLASGSSSATGKLIHGGLAFLQGMQLAAMHEAVAEREILMHAAPHLVRPHRFILPHHERMASPQAIGMGLFALDRAAKTRLPRSRRIDLQKAEHGLHPHFERGFAYMDCVADDSRLTVANAIDARAHGAQVYTRTRCTVAEREGGRWRLALESTRTGERNSMTAAILVNAAGSAAAEVHNHLVDANARVRATLRKRTYIAVHTPNAESLGYALPTAEGGVVYSVPIEPDVILIGPLDQPHSAGSNASVDRRAAGWLADLAGQYFETPIAADDIVWSTAAIDATPADGRGDHAILVDSAAWRAPVVTVIGGTYSGHRKLAEAVVAEVAKFHAVTEPWTAQAPLPGGVFPVGGQKHLVNALLAAYPFLAKGHAQRLVRLYGTRATGMLTGARSSVDLGASFGADLTEAEVTYLMAEEWAETAEDVLWRRSKLGLTFSREEAAALDNWMAAKTEARVAV